MENPSPPTLSPMAQNIKDARERKGLTQLALAHLLGYRGEDAGAYISRVERGHTVPRIPTLQSIADILKTTVGDLLKARK